MAELEQSIQNQIDELQEKSDNEYDAGNLTESISLLEQAWEILPPPKVIYDDSYHIVRFICETSLEANMLKNAQKWIDKIFDCDLERIDDGGREFLAGKVAYEANDYDKAKAYFTTANVKSEGRCFEDEDSKYLDFFNQ